jgi:hypothetical protein
VLDDVERLFHPSSLRNAQQQSVKVHSERASYRQAPSERLSATPSGKG